VASLRGALLLLVAVAFLTGILPAGVVLDQWVERELERRAQRDLATAPSLVAARDAALHDAMMMHAKELAHDAAVAAALRAGDRTQGLSLVEPVARSYRYGGVLLGPDGDVWLGPVGSAALADATRAGEMPVRVVADDSGLHLVSLAPVFAAREWLGAVGVTLPLDAAAAGALAGLTHSDVVLLIGADGRLRAAPDDSVLGYEIARAWTESGSAAGVGALRIRGARYLVNPAAIGGATALFVRDLRRELAMLNVLRRVVLVTGAGALALALLLGYLLAGRLAYPVRALAAAADRLAGGDFAAPLPRSRIREVVRVTGAFADMRRSLAQRLEELRSANRMLEERQARLSALQSELIKRERIATSARMAAELAHEIRNPVANIRNFLELLERRLRHDTEAREFAVMAIDELLRMHELAERMLHLNRPREPDSGSCDAVAVARDVVALTDLGNAGAPIAFTLAADGPAEVAMPADALKQILLNLVQNARDAKPDGLVLDIGMRTIADDVFITVSDNGPGIPPRLQERIFDPFFTTRGQAGGVGLGLFLVEGMARGHGGSASLLERPGCTGACFQLKLPAAQRAPRRDAQPRTSIPVAAES
jgi:signal transduction histidine kinase